MHALRIGWVEKFDQPRQAPRREVERECPAQRLVEIRLLAHRQRGRTAPLGLDHREFPQPSLQEKDVRRSRRQLQRVEAGRRAAAERQILSPERANQNLEASILVEHDLRHVLPAEHRNHEADEDGLAGSGRAADQRMSGVLAAAAVRIGRIARMEREVVRRARRGHEHGERLAPVIAARAAARIVVKRGHRREIARRDRRLAWPVREISGQLRPERGFQRKVLARDQHAGVGEKAARQRDSVVELFEPGPEILATVVRRIDGIRQHLQREMMIPHHELVARQCIQRLFRSRACESAKSPAFAMRLNCRCSSACAAALVRKAKDCVSTNGNGADKRRSYRPTKTRRRILLDAEHGADERIARAAVFDRLVSEQQSRGDERLVERSARQRHAAPFAVREQPEVLEQRRTPDAAIEVSSERFRVVARERCAQRLRELRGRVQPSRRSRAASSNEVRARSRRANPAAAPAAGRCTTAR